MAAEHSAPSRAQPAQPVVLVLASGRGERFAASGGAVHKLRAPLGGTTVLEHTLAAVRASGLPWHVEDAGHPGMGDSIAAAGRTRLACKSSALCSTTADPSDCLASGFFL